MDIKRNGSQASTKGPAEYFTGTVRLDAPFKTTAPPGARTAWHTHPLGQTLIVTFGCGRVQRDGGPIEEIRAGDISSGSRLVKSTGMAPRRTPP